MGPLPQVLEFYYFVRHCRHLITGCAQCRVPPLFSDKICIMSQGLQIRQCQSPSYCSWLQLGCMSFGPGSSSSPNLASPIDLEPAPSTGVGSSARVSGFHSLWIISTKYCQSWPVMTRWANVKDRATRRVSVCQPQLIVVICWVRLSHLHIFSHEKKVTMLWSELILSSDDNPAYCWVWHRSPFYSTASL